MSRAWPAPTRLRPAATCLARRAPGCPRNSMEPWARLSTCCWRRGSRWCCCFSCAAPGRSWCFAWGLLLVGLLVAVALFSHEPGLARTYPSPPSSNLLGPPGAWLSQELYGALGAAVHVLLATWFTLVLLLLLRGARPKLVFRL